MSASVMKKSIEHYEDVRRSLCGDSFSVPSFAVMGAVLCSELVPRMSPQTIVQRLGLAPAAHPRVLIPMTRWLAYGGDPDSPASSRMLVQQLGLTVNHTRANVRVSCGVVLGYIIWVAKDIPMEEAEIMDNMQLFKLILPHLTFFLDVTERCGFMSEELKDAMLWNTQASASSKSQWALPDLMCQPQIALGTAGLLLGTAELLAGAPDRTRHCRTSTWSSRSHWALPDFYRELEIALALPDFYRELQIALSSRSHWHCRTSTESSRSDWALPDFYRELQIALGTAGLFLPERMSEDMPDRMSSRRCSAWQLCLPGRIAILAAGTPSGKRSAILAPRRAQQAEVRRRRQ
eukprot:s6176_g1.t1